VLWRDVLKLPSLKLSSPKALSLHEMNQKHILLVEDEDHLLKIIQLNLELEEYAVTTAVTG
jgi:hypothetical protein